MDNEATLHDRVTSICRTLPEVTVEEGHHPHRGYKVAGKNLGWFTVNEHGSGRIALVVHTEAKENEALVASDPERFELPKYVARHGYVSYFLDLPDRPVDWDEVTELLRDSYRLQAPKRLVRLLDDG